ncbi:MAG: hypothetical protein FWE72_03640 [Spirochaetaceae bacterium]|nr:hypothetical protein [Spirochaetaceae bacterium]
MICPKCGSDHISEEFHTTTDTQTNNYNVGSGICGALLFGWPGLLCGLCDSGQKNKTIQTKVIFKCNNCGATFYQ